MVGHSDVAPARKEDPGELFPWEALAKRRLALPSPTRDLIDPYWTDAGFLLVLQRPLEALLHDGAATADGLGLLDLQQRGTGVADGEEKLRVFLAANGVVTPVHGCYLSLVLRASCL